jgi:Tol biopolymer transport system component
MVPAPVSAADGRDIHNVVLSDGTMLVASNRPGGAGRSDIWRIPRGGSAQNLGAPINDAASQPDLYVSPDGKWMILVITGGPGGLGGDDLFVSEFANGAWSAPRHLGAPINSAEYEYGPAVSPDGKWVYFTSHRAGGNADVYRISVERLGRERRRGVGA